MALLNYADSLPWRQGPTQSQTTRAILPHQHPINDPSISTWRQSKHPLCASCISRSYTLQEGGRSGGYFTTWFTMWDQTLILTLNSFCSLNIYLSPYNLSDTMKWKCVGESIILKTSCHSWENLRFFFNVRTMGMFCDYHFTTMILREFTSLQTVFQIRS